MAFASMMYGRTGGVEVERGRAHEPDTLHITCGDAAFAFSLTRSEAAELARQIAVTLEAMGLAASAAAARDRGDA